MLSISKSLTLATLAFACSALADAQSVHTDYDHHADFSRYHTFCGAPRGPA